MFTMISSFLSKQWVPVVLAVISFLVILLIVMSNGEKIMSVFGYETRDTIVEKLKQRDEQLNLMATVNAKLNKDIDEARTYERSQCETRIAGIMAEIETKRKSEEIIVKADNSRDDILTEVEIRLAVEEQKPAVKNKPTVKKTKRVIQDSDLTKAELDQLSMVNITMIHDAYAAIGVPL